MVIAYAAFCKIRSDFIQSRMLTRAISNAQKVEGMNFDQRKHILDYDNVLAQHREAMYARRDQILTATDLKPIIKKMQYSAAYDLTKCLEINHMVSDLFIMMN